MKIFINRKNKKLNIIILLITIVLVLTNISYAYLDENENINEDIKDITIETMKNINEKPIVNSRVGLIFDRNSKTILYEKNGLKQVPMASTTKIMTAIVTLENANLKDIVTIDKKSASIGGSRLKLKVNDKITVNDLLYGLMLRSGNDAAVALAIHVGGSVEKFADMMNAKAKEMGWVNSHFISPHGLDNKEHYTTAYELACMADYALQKNKFKEIVGTKSCNIYINGKPRTITNTNELLKNLNGVYGVKTGFTNGAGRCLVTSCKRGNLDIITVVLGANTKKIRTQDSIKLIEYANRNYKVVDFKKNIEENFEKWKLLNQRRIYINKGKTQSISLKLEDMPYTKRAILNMEVDNIDLEINCLYNLEAPINENEIIGTVKIKVKGNIIDTINIKNESQIQKKEILDYFIDFLSLLP